MDFMWGIPGTPHVRRMFCRRQLGSEAPARRPAEGLARLASVLAPSGLLQLATYSRVSVDSWRGTLLGWLRHAAASRHLFDDGGVVRTPTPAEIREIRREVLALPPGHEVRDLLVHFREFFTYAGCHRSLRGSTGVVSRSVQGSSQSGGGQRFAPTITRALLGTNKRRPRTSADDLASAHVRALGASMQRPCCQRRYSCREYRRQFFRSSCHCDSWCVLRHSGNLLLLEKGARA